jgi:hypothetical protein
MQKPATISHLSVVPAAAPVKQLLTSEEKKFLDLMAGIFVQDLFKQLATFKTDNNEKGNRLHPDIER